VQPIRVALLRRGEDCRIPVPEREVWARWDLIMAGLITPTWLDLPCP